MDLQETVERLRKVIEDALAPSIHNMQIRLDGLGKDVQELHEEIRELNGRFDTLIAAMLSARQPTYPDAILTRLEQVEKVLAELRK